MANKPNAMLAKIEEKYRKEYETKLMQAKAAFLIKLNMALQQSADAALMAADDTFDVNAYSAEKFHTAHIEYMNKISHMAVIEDEDDDEMVWTKATVDRRLLQIVGKDNFAPWDERYTVGKEMHMKMKVAVDLGANIPMRAHKNDAGLDLYATKGGLIFPFSRKAFDTGVHVAIPEGFVGLLTSKSGLMLSNGITSRGTIDCGYIGTIRAVLFNHSWKFIRIKPNQKITQLVILPIITPEPELVDSLEATDRGNGGFGSTGKF